MYSQLEQEWKSICENDPSLVLMLEQKLSPLLNHEEEEYVVQGMNLLEQFGSCSLVLQVGPGFDFFGFGFQRFKPAEIVADFKAVDRFGQGIEAGRGRGWHFAENGR